MNANRLISMIINMVFRTMLRKGVNAGIQTAANRFGKNNKNTGHRFNEDAAQSGEDRVLSDQAKKQSKQAQQAIRMMRRMR